MFFDRDPIAALAPLLAGRSPADERARRRRVRQETRAERDLAVARVKELARRATDRPIEFEEYENAEFGRTLVLRMSAGDGIAAGLIHEAIIDACRGRELALNTIIDLGPIVGERAG